MRPLKTLSLLGFSPILQSAACSISPLLSPPQCSLYSNQATTDSYAFRIAASYSAKGHRLNARANLFSLNPKNETLPRRKPGQNRPNSGQDSFFASTIGNSSNIAFGVADGVGGWADSGIDSAFFSHGLCEGMADVAAASEETPNRKLRARELLQKGYDVVVADKSITGGGTTACIAIGRSDGNLEVANLGDSGFVQLRPNAISYSSNPQTHAFNTPFQLSIIPPKVLARSRAFGGEPLSDYPKDASISHHVVKHGDVLVFATDGVWDNITPVDVLKIVSHYMIGFDGWKAGKGELGVSEELRAITTTGGIAKEHENTIQALLAVAITGEAKMASENTKLDGPFAKEVHKYYPGEDYHGGKVDDICVVVAVVVRNEEKSTTGCGM